MSSRGSLTVLVAGASGRFGPVVRRLVERGHHVRAGVRDLDSDAAVRLRALGAELARVDFDDPGSLTAAARGVDAVFASGTAHRAGSAGELRHGANLARALATVPIGQLVFVSGAGADARTGVPVLEAKRAVEGELRARGIPATVIAPVYLMENLFNPWNVGPMRSGMLPWPVAPDLRVAQVAVVDVLQLAVVAIERREEFIGARLEIAADALTGQQAAAALSRILGTSLEAVRLSREGIAPGLVALFDWLERRSGPRGVNERSGPPVEVGMLRFEDWGLRHASQLRDVLRDGGRGARAAVG